MLWAISAVTTPLALVIYLCTNDCADLLPLNYGVARKFLLYIINTLPLLFVALAFLLDTHFLMICGLAIIIFVYIILYVARMLYLFAAFLHNQLGSKKNLGQLFRMGLNRGVAAESVIVGIIVALMLLSGFNTAVITW